MSKILQSLGLQPIIQSPAQRFAQLERGDQAALAAPRPMARVTQAPIGYGPQRMPQAADAGQIMRDQMIRGAMAPAVTYSGPNYLEQTQQPEGFLGKLMGMSDVEAAGLGGAGRALMEASGPTAMPKTTLGMLNAALVGYNQAAQAQKQMDLQNRMAMAKISRESDFMQKLRIAGIDPSTPEGQQLARDLLMRPQTQISMGQGKEDELLFKAALEDRKLFRQEAKVDPKIETRLDQAIALLEKGVETGSFEQIVLPFKKLGVGMGLIGEEEAEAIGEQEVFKSIGDQLAPMMRVVGSGSSSDKDVELFRSATISMDKTPYANLIIAKTIKQTNRNNKERLALLDKFIDKNKTTFGFDEYAYEAVGPVFHRAGSNEELQGLYDAGKVQTGDVYYDEEFGKFMFVEIE